MTRIYYKEEKIAGEPIETPVINVKNFDYLMECPKPQLSFELAPDGSGGYSEWFRYTLISNRARHYDAGGEGKFYLPKAMIFWDIDDFTFPSQYYFIAKIGDELEIRSVKGGADVKWFQTVDLHKQVTDSSVIAKMHGSMLSIIEFLKDYEEPEKPKAPRIEGMKLNKQVMESFLAQLGAQNVDAQRIVDMANSPSDYFEANEKDLMKYQILEPSKEMYLLYLVAAMEESGIMATVDWKAEYPDVVYALNEISGIRLESDDSGKFKRSTAGKILSALNQEAEGRTDKTIFIIGTDTDSYSFGLIEKDKLNELKRTGKELGITLKQPKR